MRKFVRLGLLYFFLYFPGRTFTQELVTFWQEDGLDQVVVLNGLVAGGTVYGPIRIWKIGDPGPGNLLKEHPLNVNALARAKNVNRLVSTGPSFCYSVDEKKNYRVTSTITWDLDKFERISRFEVFGDKLDLSSGGKFIVVQDSKEKEPNSKDGSSASVYDCASGNKLLTHDSSEPFINAARFSPDEENIVIVSGHYQLSYWSLKEKKKLFEWESNQKIRKLAFSHDCKNLFASGGYDSPHSEVVQHWNILKKKVISEYPVRNTGVLEVSPDGKTLAMTSGGHFWLFNTTTGKEIAKWEGRHGAITGLSFSPDGKMLASVGTHSKICLWRLP